MPVKLSKLPHNQTPQELDKFKTEFEEYAIGVEKQENDLESQRERIPTQLAGLEETQNKIDKN